MVGASGARTEYATYLGSTSSAGMHGVCEEAHVTVTRRVTCLPRAHNATEVT